MSTGTPLAAMWPCCLLTARSPEAVGASHPPGTAIWVAEVEGVAVLCADRPSPSLLVGRDRAEVLVAASQLGLHLVRALQVSDAHALAVAAGRSRMALQEPSSANPPCHQRHAVSGRWEPSRPVLHQNDRGGLWHYVAAAPKQSKLAMVTARSGRDNRSVTLRQQGE